MKFSDRVSGLLAFALGLAVVIRTQSFPPMPGQPIGPSMFPAAIGAALMVAGSLLFVTGARSAGSRSIERVEWTRRPRMVFNFTLVIVDLVFYAVAVTPLGFLITAVIFLSVLLLAFGVRRSRIIPLAVTVTVLIHYAFYTLLRVPLPWGVLAGIAW